MVGDVLDGVHDHLSEALGKLAEARRVEGGEPLPQEVDEGRGEGEEAEERVLGGPPRVVLVPPVPTLDPQDVPEHVVEGNLK